MGSTTNGQGWMHGVLVAALLAFGLLGASTASAQDGGEGDGNDAPADAAETSTTTDDTTTAVDEMEEAAAEDAAEAVEDAVTDDESGETPEEFVADPAQQRAMGDGIAVTTLSVGSLVTGIIFLVQAGNDSDAADQASGAGDVNSAQDLNDRADRERAVGITFTALGIALAGVATWLWIDYARDRQESGDVAFHVLPSIDPQGGGGFVLGGSF